MPELIKFFGGLTAFAGAAGIALAVYLKLDPQPEPGMPSAIHAAIYGVSVLISGTLLYCMGAVVDHLKAIRDFQRRQIEIFERMGKNRASSVGGPRNLPESPAPNAGADSPSPDRSDEAAIAQDDENQVEVLHRRAS